MVSTHHDKTDISIDQKQDYLLEDVDSFPYAKIRYFYSRSSESRTGDVVGQDHIAIRHGKNRLSFAVCDGVGQSFCGNIASAFLSVELVQWLWQYGEAIEEDQFAQAATDFVNQLAVEGQKQVQSYPLDNFPPLLKSALDGQRKYGSESMFVAGCLLAGEDETNPLSSGRLLLCWLGDCELQVFNHAGQNIDIGAAWTTSERWSTARGIKNADLVHTWIGDLNEISRILAYSDGLSGVRSDLNHILSDSDALYDTINTIHNSSDDDDISVVDINLTVSIPDFCVPVLYPIINPLRLGDFHLEWTLCEGATGYGIEEAFSPDFADIANAWETNATASNLKNTPSGDFYYRVYALYGSAQSIASNIESTNVRLPVEILPPEYLAELAAYRLHWQECAGCEHYIIEESETSDFNDITGRFNVSSTSCTFQKTGVGNYFYRIFAQYPDVFSIASDVIPIVLRQVVIELDVVMFLENGGLVLHWTAPRGANNFVIEESTSSNFETVRDRKRVNANYRTNFDYPIYYRNLRDVYYRVIAEYNDGFRSEPSNIVFGGESHEIVKWLAIALAAGAFIILILRSV